MSIQGEFPSLANFLKNPPKSAIKLIGESANLVRTRTIADYYAANYRATVKDTHCGRDTIDNNSFCPILVPKLKNSRPGASVVSG